MNNVRMRKNDLNDANNLIPLPTCVLVVRPSQIFIRTSIWDTYDFYNTKDQTTVDRESTQDELH